MRAAITVSSLSPWQSVYLLLDKLEPRSLFFLLVIAMVLTWLTVAGLIGSIGRVRRARWEAFAGIHLAKTKPEVDVENVCSEDSCPNDLLHHVGAPGCIAIKYQPEPSLFLPTRPTRSKENDQ